MHSLPRAGFFLARQSLQILVIAFTIFLLLRAVPGDVLDFYAARGDYDDTALAALRADLGLDDSLVRQFQSWAHAALGGDLGMSMRYGADVSGMLATALPTSLKLAALALAVGLVTGIGLAVLAIGRPRLVRLVEALNIWSIAVPSFCTGVVGILVFSVWLGWLPIRGQWFLPVLILGADIAGQIAKPLYEELAETTRAGFVRTATAKGLSRGRIVWRHILPNSLSVAVALSGIILGGLIGGTLTMEALFALPGLGSLTLEAIRGRDYPVIQAAIMAMATFVVFVNVTSAALQRWLDPRRAHALS